MISWDLPLSYFLALMCIDYSANQQFYHNCLTDHPACCTLTNSFVLMSCPMYNAAINWCVSNHTTSGTLPMCRTSDHLWIHSNVTLLSPYSRNHKYNHKSIHTTNAVVSLVTILFQKFLIKSPLWRSNSAAVGQ